MGDTLVVEESVAHDSYGRAINAQIVEHATEVLDTIRKQGYKIALIANDDGVNVRNLLHACGLENYFDVTTISEEAGTEKPDERIFRLALHELGVEPGNAVMVGNRLDADIVGAKRAGLKSVWFKWNSRYDGTMKSQEEKPDFTIKSLEQLPELLTIL
jgi:putative hydrolase of the HAD superfamily